MEEREIIKNVLNIAFPVPSKDRKIEENSTVWTQKSLLDFYKSDYAHCRSCH